MKIKVRRTIITDDEMTVDEVDKYLKQMRPIYVKVKLRIKWAYIDTDYLTKSVLNRSYSYLKWA